MVKKPKPPTLGPTLGKEEGKGRGGLLAGMLSGGLPAVAQWRLTPNAVREPPPVKGEGKRRKGR